MWVAKKFSAPARLFCSETDDVIAAATINVVIAIETVISTVEKPSIELLSGRFISLLLQR